MRSFVLPVILILLLIPITVQAQNLEYAGSTLWSGANDIKVAGDYAYCAFANGLVILNVSDHSNPVFVSQTYCPGKGKRLEISGNYVFIADSVGGLQIINVSDIFHPAVVGRYATSGPANDVFISGDYAYVAADSAGMQIINISDLTNPLFTGTFTLPNGYRATTIFEDGGIAFLGTAWEYNYFGAVFIINITDMVNPDSISSINNYMGPITAIQVIRNNLFFTSGYQEVPVGQGSFCIYDISNPSTPISLNEIGEGAMVDLRIDNNMAYFIDESRLKIYDITNLSQPNHVGDYSCMYLGRFSVSQGYAYITSNNDIRTLDISNPSQPVLTGEYVTDYLPRYIVANNDMGYVINGYGKIFPVDITNQSDPVAASEISTSQRAIKMAVSGEYAYIAGDSGLQIFNINNFDSLNMVGSFHTVEAVLGLAVSGSYAYLASHSQGLQVINIDDPANPERVRRYQFSACDIKVVGDYAYLIGGGKLFIMNIENKVVPIMLSQTYIDDRINSLAIKGSYAYVGGYPYFTILDISDPATPHIVYTYPTDKWATETKISGSFLYLANHDSGIDIFDISNPTNPTLVSNYYLPGCTNNIYYYNDLCYVANDYSMVILRINPMGIDDSSSKPNSFSLSPNYPNPFNAQTTISYSLDQPGPVSIAVYNVLGQKIATLLNGIEQAGEHKLVWDARDIPSGAYFARLETSDRSQSIKMTVVK
jgi:hypothetical protein